MDSVNTADLLKQLAELKSQNEKLKAASKSAGPSIKLGEKGTICLYGVGRYPVALYRRQWEIVASQIENINETIAANKETLDAKEAAHEAAKAAEKAKAKTA